MCFQRFFELENIELFCFSNFHSHIEYYSSSVVNMFSALLAAL